MSEKETEEHHHCRGLSVWIYDKVVHPRCHLNDTVVQEKYGIKKSQQYHKFVDFENVFHKVRRGAIR